MKYKYYIIISSVIFLVICGLTILLIPKNIVDSDINKNNSYPVEIKGEVLFPGIYTVYKGDRLETLISYAGGYTKLADRKINTQELIDPKKEYTILRETNIEYIIKQDLNKIEYKDLLKIPSITENRALNIIVYRSINKHFNKVDELINVKDIGEKTFTKIKDYFFIG